MIRRLFRFAFKLGLTAGVGAVVSKVLDRRRTASTDWSTSNEPWPPIQPPVEEEAAPVATSVPAGTATASPASASTPASTGTSTPTGTSSAKAVPPTDEATRWAEPDDEGGCTTSHPVKAKMSSGVFHLPGMAAYERTNADRCYPDADSAEADGLRQAKR